MPKNILQASGFFKNGPKVLGVGFYFLLIWAGMKLIGNK
jgi:hypothetical protein